MTLHPCAHRAGSLSAALTLVLAACIGRPVVGERDPDDAQMTGLCEDDGLGCGGPLEKFVPPSDSLFASGEPCGNRHESMRFEAEDPPAQTVVRDLDLSCRTVEITLEHEAEVVLSQPNLRHAQLALISEGSAILTLRSAIAEDTSIRVEGMSTLRLEELDTRELRIDATSSALGWNVWIEDSALRDLAVRSGPDARVTVMESQLRDATLVAGQLGLFTVSAESLIADVKELEAAGTDLVGGVMRVRRGRFLSGTLEDGELHGCETLQIGDSSLSEVKVDACSVGALRLSNSAVSASVLRGPVFALQARITEVVLGGEPGSSLSLLDSHVNYSLMCDMESLAVRGSSALHCARCHPLSPPAVCIDESSTVAVVACPELVEAPVCREDLPQTVLEDHPSGAPNVAEPP